MAIHINDIVNSPLNEEQVEVNSKDIDLKVLRQETGEKKSTQKSTVISVKKTVANPDGTKTEFDSKFELNVQSPQEMREYLEALGYSVRSPAPASQPATGKQSTGKSIIKLLLSGWNTVTGYIARNKAAYEAAERAAAEKRKG